MFSADTAGIRRRGWFLRDDHETIVHKKAINVETQLQPTQKARKNIRNHFLLFEHKCRKIKFTPCQWQRQRISNPPWIPAPNCRGRFWTPRDWSPHPAVILDPRRTLPWRRSRRSRRKTSGAACWGSCSGFSAASSSPSARAVCRWVNHRCCVEQIFVCIVSKIRRLGIPNQGIPVGLETERHREKSVIHHFVTSVLISASDLSKF